MIRASALYLSLIVSLLIVLTCGALLLIGFSYRMLDQRQQRWQRLSRNLGSAQRLLLSGSGGAGAERLNLFEGRGDSVLVEKSRWGIYGLGRLCSWKGTDTLRAAFLTGVQDEDSLRVLYLADEDRPVSISGRSLIRGTARLPKAGIRAAYVGGSGYSDPVLVHGRVQDSERSVPLPDQEVLNSIRGLLEDPGQGRAIQGQLPDSLVQSFFAPLSEIRLSGQARLPAGLIRGHVLIRSDSVLVVPAGARLDQVILLAPYIRIEAGFRGRLQAFASDSIRVEHSVYLDYPSALGVLKNDTARFQASLSVGRDAVVEGQLIACEQERSELMPVIWLGEGSLVRGEVYCQGYAGLSKTAAVQGSVTAIRLTARLEGAIYENYLIDVSLDRSLLSRYYLRAELFPSQKRKGGLLCRLY